MSETTAKVAELKKVLPSGPVALAPSRFTRDIAYSTPHSSARIPKGMTLQDVLKKETWAHIAHALVPGQVIRVVADDNSFSAQLMVIQATRLEAVLVVEWEKRHDTASLSDAVAPEDAYRIHFVAGGDAKWRISRISDNQTISEGHGSKAVAQAELRGHLQAMAA